MCQRDLSINQKDYFAISEVTLLAVISQVFDLFDKMNDTFFENYLFPEPD